jgi:hypothetical protein
MWRSETGQSLPKWAFGVMSAFPPFSDRTADTTGGPFRANTGSPFGSMQGEAPSPSRRSVQRRQDRGKPLLYLGASFRMREYVEFILAYCGEDQQSYMRRVEP